MKKLTRNIKRFQVIDGTLLKSGLPNTLDLQEIKQVHGLDVVIDLSDRERKPIANWCQKNNIEYHKFYVDRFNPKKEDYLKALSLIKKRTLVCCFHGKSRSRSLVALWQIKQGENTTKIIEQLQLEMPDRNEMMQMIAQCSFEI